MTQRIETLEFEDLRDIGGALCWDLSNTVDWRGTIEESDRLKSYEDFLAWSQCFQLLQPDNAVLFMRSAENSPQEASSAIHRVRLLREALYRIGSGLAAGKSAAPIDALDEVNKLLPGLLSYMVLTDDEHDPLTYRLRSDDLLSPLTPVVWSLIDLLRGPEVARVRECANASCHWLYIDRSRNKSRRWCAMWNCGNRAKGRRFYHAHKGKNG